MAAFFWWEKLPWLRHQPGWFFHPRHGAQIGPALAALSIGGAPWLCRLAWAKARERRHASSVVLMVIAGVAVQCTLTFLVREGLDQTFQRLEAGHGEFVRVAAARRGMLWETLRNYDSLFAGNQLGVFAGTKPPGTLAAYMLLDRLAHCAPVRSVLAPMVALAQASPWVSPVAESAALLTVALPVMTFLTLGPLLRLGQSLFDDWRAGFAAALLYLTAPSVLLIDLHLDGALFPLITLGALQLAVHSARSERPAYAFASGAVAMLGVYCSYGMLPALMLSVLAAGGLGLERAWTEPQRPRWRSAVPAIAVLAGAASCLLVLVLVLKFQPILRFKAAMAMHATWKAGVPHDVWRKLSLAEFGLYAGPPLMLAFTVEVARACAGVARLHGLRLAATSIAVALLLLALAWDQGTNEAARMWLFLVPLIGFATGSGLVLRERSSDASQQRSEGRLPNSVVVLACAQGALAVAMKTLQPW